MQLYFRRVAASLALFLVAQILPLCVSAEVARFSPFDIRTSVSAEHFENIEPRPVTGGTLRSGSMQRFGTLNFMSFPSIAPARIGYIFDSLLVPSATEPAVYYGLLAREFEVSHDFQEVRVALDERARWHDGTPITARDVAFTISILRDHGFPSDRVLFANVDVDIESDGTLVVTNSEPASWRWIARLGQTKIQSQAYWTENDPTADTLVPPLGSGPYMLADVERNRQFVLERAEEYWAVSHPVNQGRWNFDALIVEYFSEKFTMMAALKRGELDILVETDPTDWRAGYDSPALESGKLVRTTLGSPNGGTLQLLLFNLRRPMFQDQRVRQAISLVFENEWYSDFFEGVFNVPAGFYAGTRLAANNQIDILEEQLFAPFEGELPRDIMAAPGPETTLQNMTTRNRIREADTLLTDAGFYVIDGRRIDPRSGTPVSLGLVTSNSEIAQSVLPFRDWLSRIGIELIVSVQDPTTTRQLLNDAQFDLTPISWRPADPPGRIESFVWYGGYSDDQGFGVSGLDSGVANALIEIMRSSIDAAEITAAAQALDRYLRWSRYAIPMWHESDVWFVHKSGLQFASHVNPHRRPDEFWWWAE